jgi:hypothetical protein
MLIKLRFRIPEILFGVLLAVALFALGAAFWSSPNSSMPTQAQTGTKSGESSPGNKHEIAWWQDPVAVFTLGLVFIGLLQACIFYGQMRLIRKSLAPAKEAAEAAKLNAEAVIDAERAYLFIEIGLHNIPEMNSVLFEIDGPDDGTKFPIYLSYTFKNFGRTPAILREISYGTAVAPELPQMRTYVPVIHLPCRVLAADKPTPPLPVDDLPVITRAVAKSIRDTENTFWFYGEVIYDDMFGWRRTFNFVWHYNAISEGFTFYRWTETQEERKT